MARKNFLADGSERVGIQLVQTIGLGRLSLRNESVAGLSVIHSSCRLIR